MKPNAAHYNRCLYFAKKEGKYPKPKTETVANPNTREENGEKAKEKGEGKKETPARNFSPSAKKRRP